MQTHSNHDIKKVYYLWDKMENQNFLIAKNFT